MPKIWHFWGKQAKLAKQVNHVKQVKQVIIVISIVITRVTSNSRRKETSFKIQVYCGMHDVGHLNQVYSFETDITEL